MTSACWHMHLEFYCITVIFHVPWKRRVLWHKSQIAEIQRNHKKTTLLLLSSPLPPPLFIHRKERYCFPSNPLPIRHSHTHACTHQGLSRVALRSCRSEEGRKERRGAVGAEAHRTRCILDNTDTRQNHHRPSLCRLNKGICVHLCVSTRKEGRNSDVLATSCIGGL